MSYRLRRQVIDYACEVAGTRIPILVGIRYRIRRINM
jgi:hypothetical protein